MTGLVEYQGDNKLTHYEFVRDGIQGNYEVLWRMIELVRETTLKDKGFENFIKHLVAINGFDSYSDTQSLFEFLFDFVKSKVTYLQDQAGKTESIKDARTTLEDGFGDCDDYAILNASILAVLGYDPFLVIAKYPDSQIYQHVYACTYVNGKRYVFDETLPDAEFNKEAQGMTSQEYGVFADYPETHGVRGAYRSIKSLLTQTYNNAKEVAPILASFAPFGFFGNSALRTMFHGIDDTPQSINELGSQLSGKITDIIIQLQNGLITQKIASKQAHELYSKLFAYGNPSDSTFQTIEAGLQKKLNYIDSVGLSGGTVFSVDRTALSYLAYGVLAVGVVYYFSKKGN